MQKESESPGQSSFPDNGRVARSAVLIRHTTGFRQVDKENMQRLQKYPARREYLQHDADGGRECESTASAEAVVWGKQMLPGPNANACPFFDELEPGSPKMMAAIYENCREGLS